MVKIAQFLVYDQVWGLHYNPYTILGEISNVLNDNKIKKQNIIWKVRISSDLFRYIDGTRHPIEANSLQELHSIQKSIVANLVESFSSSDIFFISFGLSEIWEQYINGSWYTLNRLPYIKNFKQEKYRNRNMTVEECKNCINEIINIIKTIKNNAKIILSIAPIPLKTSCRERHIRISETHNKSTLLSSVYEILDENEFDNVFYFPAYEIFYSQNNNEIWQIDMRHPTKMALEFVYREFIKIFSSEYVEIYKDIGFNVKEIIL